MSYSRRQFMASSALLGLFAPWRSALAQQSQTPWRNWSGGQVCHPAGRFSPASEDELMDYLRRTSGEIRPVGSGHSFSALVPTDGHLVVL
ncbi:MAG: FAD-linked oxidoreductase, partial [Pseudomonadales bacterium]|nr:FAD-linked oxidoreductase [Pseudomonadales bacterium]